MKVFERLISLWVYTTHAIINDFMFSFVYFLNTLYWKNWMIWLVQNWIADISTQWLSVLEIHLLLCWFDWWKVTKQQFIIPIHLFPHCNWTKQNLFLSKDKDKSYLIILGCPSSQVLAKKLKNLKLIYLLIN